MVSVARKNLFHDKTRFLISILGVTFSVFLMFFILSMYSGFNLLLKSYVYNQDVDIWIVERGKRDFFQATSFLPNNLSDELSLVGGVSKVYPLQHQTNQASFKNENISLITIGYDTKSGVGGPWSIIEGKSKPGSGEIIIDKVFSKKHGVIINDVINIKGRDFRVVGISDSTSVLIWQYAFITFEDSIKIFNMPDSVNHFMIKVNNPQFSDSIINTIKNSFNVNAFTKAEFINNNKELINEGFLPMLLGILIVGLLVGSSFVALTIYTITVEKIKDYGILKAIGASNSRLYSIIFKQALIISIIGLIIGSLLVYLTSRVTSELIPEIYLSINIDSFIVMAIMSVTISIISSYPPIRKVSKVDPLMIFR